MKLLATAPATSANLGPGFDCLGLALELSNEVELDTEGPAGVVTVEGEGAGELPGDANNLVVRAATHLADACERTLPDFALTCRNRIPLECGLGSSAAAVVAGLALADRLLDTRLPPDRLFELAVEVEGHPDNVAAAMFGGLVLAFAGRDERWQAERLDPAPELRPVVLVPTGTRLATTNARLGLPVDVPFGDAAFNAGRAALAVVALTARPDLLPEALEDRLHQPTRLAMVPDVAQAFSAVRDAGVPVCVSGSGPSLLAFESEDARVPDLGEGWAVHRVRPRASGVEVREPG